MEPTIRFPCPDCDGRGYISRTRDGYVECPTCSAPMRGTSKYYNKWNDVKKEFQVSLSIPLTNVGKREEQLIRGMPPAVARTSRCSCGAPLSLLSHSIRREKDEITFEGVYACTVCSGRGSSGIGKLMGGLARLLRGITKLEIGPTGVKFEKKDSIDNDK